MDNLTHTMVGACLGQAGLNRRTGLAVPALLIGANLPDLDILALLRGEDFQFAFRRGWTHGVLGLAVLPAVLVGGLLLVGRLRHRRNPAARPVHPAALLGLAYLATLTHPLLDWFNTYGMRWLMPFDPTWTYGDTLYIVDPWLWLALAFPLVAGTRSGGLWWALGGLLATALLVSQAGALSGATTIWAVGVLAMVAVRRGWVPCPAPERAAWVALAGSVVYVIAMFAGSVAATRVAARWFRSEGVEVASVMAGPAAINPFARDVVGVTPDGYRFARVTLGRGPVRSAGEPMVSDSGPIVDAARRAPQLAGFMSWIRYPSFRVEPRPGGYRVAIRDARYAARGGGFGTAWVSLDSALGVVDAGLNLR